MENRHLLHRDHNFLHASHEVHHRCNQSTCRIPIPLKYIILALISNTLLSHAALTETNIDWRPACEGSQIEVMHEGDVIHSVRAYAMHSLMLCEWTIHFEKGKPISAEYRERSRGKILKGDRAGEDSGENPIKKLQTFVAKDGKFSLFDLAQQSELDEILQKAKHRQ